MNKDKGLSKKTRGGYYIKDQFAMHYMTFTTVGWVDIFTRKECKDIIIDSLKYSINNKGLVINAYVLMESHIHIVARGTEGKEELSSIIRDFKKFTSNRIIKFLISSKKESRRHWLKMIFKYHSKYNSNNQRYQVWQQNNQPKVMLYPKYIFRKINYIHQNPVVAKIVSDPQDYLHSSARNYVGRKDFLLDLEIIDFGCMEGYVFI